MKLKAKLTQLVELNRLGSKIGIGRMFVKREDLNLSGSHKDRAIWPMLEHYLKRHAELDSASVFVLCLDAKTDSLS